MPFNTFTPNTTIQSSKVNENFQNTAHLSDVQVLSNKLHVPAVVNDDSGAFDLSAGNWFKRTLSPTNGTFSLTGETTNEIFIIEVVQDGVTTITWFSGIIWVDNAVPPQSASGRRDVFGFKANGGGSYLGFIVGQNML